MADHVIESRDHRFVCLNCDRSWLNYNYMGTECRPVPRPSTEDQGETACDCESMNGRFGAHRAECPAVPVPPTAGEDRAGVEALYARLCSKFGTDAVHRLVARECLDYFAAREAAVAAEVVARVLAVTEDHTQSQGKNAADCVCLGCQSRRAALGQPLRPH